MNAAPDRIALAIGDPNGVGPEIAVRAAISPAAASPLLVGDAHVIRHYVAALAPGMDTRETDGSAPARAATIHPVPCAVSRCCKRTFQPPPASICSRLSTSTGLLLARPRRPLIEKVGDCDSPGSLARATRRAARAPRAPRAC